MSAPSVTPRLPAQLEVPAEIATALMEAAIKSAQAATREFRQRKRPQRGEALAPGADTPLWNELVHAVERELTDYGAQARLARILRLPRQRIHDLIRSRRALPDAERTLLLLAWLHAKKQGADLA